MLDREADPIDLIQGADQLAALFNCPPGPAGKTWVYNLHRRSNVPIFKLSGKLCGRRSVILAWIEEREAARLSRPQGHANNNEPPAANGNEADDEHEASA